MRKKRIKGILPLLTAVILAGAIALTFAACKDGSGGGGSTTEAAGGTVNAPTDGGGGSTTKAAGGTVNAPTEGTKTSSSITVTAPATPSTGQAIEYGINTSNTAPSIWQDSTTFSSLTPETLYYIFARAKENATHDAGAASAALEVTTDASGKLAGGTVDAPTLETKTDNSITVTAPSAPSTGQEIEYAINTENTAPLTGWQGSRTFSGLEPETDYYIFARAKENSARDAGPASESLHVTTDAATCEHIPNLETGICTLCGDLTYSLGDTGPGGGKIYYRSKDGFTVEGYGSSGDEVYFADYTAHYLEAAPEYAETLQWGDLGILVDDITTNATASLIDGAANIGKGRKDTRLIVAHMNGKLITDTAAQYCVAADFGGKTDWFLPSVSELYLLYENKDHTDMASVITGYGYFWSSSQRSDEGAWIVNFQYGGNPNGIVKSFGCNTVAVRAF